MSPPIDVDNDIILLSCCLRWGVVLSMEEEEQFRRLGDKNASEGNMSI